MAGLVRSPKYSTVSTGSGTAAYVIISLKIWNGVKTSAPSTAQYTIRKDLITPTTGDKYATFEISELIRDYINIEFDGSYSCDAVWVLFGYTLYTAAGSPISGAGGTSLYLDGYGYFEEGANPTFSGALMIDNKVIWRPEDENIRIPVLCNYNDSPKDVEVVMLSKGVPVRTETLTGTDVAADAIKYASVSGDISADNYKQRVLSAGGTYEVNPLLIALDNYVDINLVDEIRTYIYDANNNQIVEKVNVRTMHCDKYPDRKVTFLNKNGAFQDVYFFAKETETINITGERYKSNVMNLQTGSYSTTAHQYQQYDKQGKERVLLNTGFVTEDYNEVMKQMMLSEYVWLTKTTDEASNIYPVIPVTNSLTMQTSLNDKMVNYAIEFEHAFDKIQNVR